MPRQVSTSFTRIRRAERRLYYWLREHHDDFAAELARTRVRERWTHAMAVITEHKLLDGRGNPPTKDAAADTWKRVCEDVAAERGRTQAVTLAAPAPRPGEIAPGVRALPEPGQAGLQAPRSKFVLDLRPATPLVEPPAPDQSHLAVPALPLPGQPRPSSPLPNPVELPAVVDVAAERQKLRQQIGANAVPLPKVVR